jgi:hypothetical protein
MSAVLVARFRLSVMPRDVGRIFGVPSLSNSVIVPFGPGRASCWKEKTAALGSLNVLL